MILCCMEKETCWHLHFSVTTLLFLKYEFTNDKKNYQLRKYTIKTNADTEEETTEKGNAGPAPRAAMAERSQEEYLLQLLFRILASAQLTLGAFPQLSQPTGLLLGKVDLIHHFSLQILFFYSNSSVFFLCLFKSQRTINFLKIPHVSTQNFTFMKKNIASKTYF